MLSAKPQAKQPRRGAFMATRAMLTKQEIKQHTSTLGKRVMLATSKRSISAAACGMLPADDAPGVCMRDIASLYCCCVQHNPIHAG